MCFFGKSRENQEKDRNFFQVLSGVCFLHPVHFRIFTVKKESSDARRRWEPADTG